MKTSMRAPSRAAGILFLNGVLALAGVRYDGIVCVDNRDLTLPCSYSAAILAGFSVAAPACA